MQNSVHYEKQITLLCGAPTNLTPFSPIRKAYLFICWKDTIPNFNFQEPTKSMDISAVPKKHPLTSWWYDIICQLL